AIQVAEDRLKAAREHVESLPASFDFRSFERDVVLMKALEQCRDAAARVHAELQDTLNEVGTRGSQAAAEVYAYIKAASRAAPGLQRTVDDLATRRSKAATRETPAGTAKPAPTEPPASTSATPAPPAAPAAPTPEKDAA